MVTTYADQIEQTWKNNVSSLSILMDELHRGGYENHFTLKRGKLICIENQKQYRTLSFHVDEIYRLIDWHEKQRGCSIFALRHRTENLTDIFVAIDICHDQLGE